MSGPGVTNRRMLARAGGAALAAALLSVAGCGKPAAGGSAASQAQAHPAQRPAGAEGGPDILTTTSDSAATTPTDVKARLAEFKITPVNGTDTLLVDGKPVTYVGPAGGAPQPIEANNALTLVGVFELSGESVAWVIIGGGDACAGTHILVPVGQTREVRGLGIDGCDDRGTMRKSGDRIVFDAGGHSGAYDHGRIVPN